MTRDGFREHGRLVGAICIGAFAGAAALVRLPFLGAGVGPDEGGYAYVAERWAHGARLYQQAWVDRPQGLLLVYRFFLQFGDNAWTIRLGALVIGCAITVVVGVIGWLLHDARTGVAAAAIYSVLGAAPNLQGFALSSELVAALPAAGAIAAALAWRRTGAHSWLPVAGVLAGVAPLMKQSGFDGLIVAGAIVLAGAPTGRSRASAFALFLSGAALPIGASLANGLAVGWQSYWLAVAGYKLGAASGATETGILRVAHAIGSLPPAWRDLRGVLLVFLIAGGFAVRRWRSEWIPLLWLLACFLGFNLGGLYWPHYYVQLLAPLALLAAIVATGLPTRLLTMVAVAVCVAPGLLFVSRLERLPRRLREDMVPYYLGFVRDQRVADFITDHTGPRTAVYVLASRADVYFLAERNSPFPYIWGHPLHEVQGALRELRGLLRARHGPELVLEYQRPDEVDPSGRLARVLTRHYASYATIPGTSVTALRHLGRPCCNSAGRVVRSRPYRGGS